LLFPSLTSWGSGKRKESGEAGRSERKGLQSPRSHGRRDVERLRPTRSGMGAYRKEISSEFLKVKWGGLLFRHLVEKTRQAQRTNLHEVSDTRSKERARLGRPPPSKDRGKVSIRRRWPSLTGGFLREKKPADSSVQPLQRLFKDGETDSLSKEVDHYYKTGKGPQLDSTTAEGVRGPQ